MTSESILPKSPDAPFSESPALSPSQSTFRPAQAFARIIPTSHPARTLVLCFDGTGDQFDADNSNIVQFVSLLSKGNKEEQLVYYQAGIGTYTIPQVATPGMTQLSKTLDEMIAWNLDAHVMGGYEFLMENYQAGDKISLFGFSRGAYTARALAGMIHKVGLLPAGNHQQVPFAYKMFTKADPIGWQQSTNFKKAFSIDVDIDFVGVWDTVCSVGLFPRRLPFTTSNTSIRVFRHAVSLDERRAKFKANLFNHPTRSEEDLGTHPGDMPKADTITATPAHSSISDEATGKAKDAMHKKHPSQRDMERLFSEQQINQHKTDVYEVWFAGCHCDIGGGSVPNDTRHNLARIPLRWMIRQCFIADSGIRFHAELLRTVGINPDSLYPKVLPRPEAVNSMPASSPSEALQINPSHPRDSTAATLVNVTDGPETNHTKNGAAAPVLSTPAKPLTEEEEDLLDARCQIYDQLSINPGWWILEWVPMGHRKQHKDRKWSRQWSFNNGYGRKIPKHMQLQENGFNFHRTVKIRMEAQDLPWGKYAPHARYTEHERIRWVD